MLFKDILDQKTEILSPEFDALFEEVLAKQCHPGDLLLISENGFCDLSVLSWDNISNLSPYVIGPGTDGHSEHSHYKFIHRYRVDNIYKDDFNVYKKDVEWNEDRVAQINQLKELEGITIELEMLLYLKIWEANMFIKKLHQLVLLSKGIPYDWHFKIQESSRDKNATGKRDVLIRNVKMALSGKYPNIHHSFQNAYRTQVRNAIAHSTYALLDRNIGLYNYVKEDTYSQLKGMSFDVWIELFHDTMVIYNELIRFFRKANEHYIAQSGDAGLLEIRVSRCHPVVEDEYRLLHYNGIRWAWAQ